MFSREEKTKMYYSSKGSKTLTLSCNPVSQTHNLTNIIFTYKRSHMKRMFQKRDTCVRV